METYILTAKPGKKLRNNIIQGKISSTTIELDGNNFYIVRNNIRNPTVQLILLPNLDSYNHDSDDKETPRLRKSKIIEFIALLKDNKLIDDETSLYFLLHANDFSVEDENIDTGKVEDLPLYDPLYKFNGKIFYYTSEADDDFYFLFLQYGHQNPEFFYSKLKTLF